MDCVTAQMLLQLQTIRHDDFNSEDRTALESHLAHCPSCEHAARRYHEWDDQIQQAILAIPVPTSLGPNLIRQLDRSERRRRRLRWAKRSLACAMFLVASGGGFAFHAYTRPVLDAETVAWRHDQDEVHVEAAFDDWRLAEKLPALPVTLDFRLHVFHGRERLAGEQVPVALFRYREGGVGRQELKIYWVRTSTFQVAQLRDAQTSRRAARVIGRSPDGRWVFLAVSTTTDLEPFLRREPLQVG